MLKWQLPRRVVALVVIASSLAVCAQVKSQPEFRPRQTGPASQRVEISPSDSGVVEPDGELQSNGSAQSGGAKPAHIGPGAKQTPKRVKASDMAKPGTGERTIREFEQKVQKEMFQSRQGIITEVKHRELLASFESKFHWYLLRYPIWPIAMNINPPLSTNNIFVLDQDNKICALISDSSQLQKFFTQKLKPVLKEEEARTVLVAWLLMQQELAQDGMFQFEIPARGLRVTKKADGTIDASGQSVVKPNGGNQGTLDSKLVFSANGKLVSTTNARNLQEGMRPICQSTKLLDKDPLVRRMAEQDILLMGRSCKFYLDEQRAKAKPELRAAIDAIWKRIEAGKR